MASCTLYDSEYESYHWPSVSISPIGPHHKLCRQLNILVTGYVGESFFCKRTWVWAYSPAAVESDGPAHRQHNCQIRRIPTQKVSL